MDEIQQYWNKFITETNRTSDVICSGDINFESSDFRNDSQVALILADKKTAFFSSLASYTIDNELLPVEGELYIILDRNNHPRCVIEISSVNILPLNEITWGMAKQEGEDSDLDEWKDRTLENLDEESVILGYKVVPNLKIVFQTFKVVYK